MIAKHCMILTSLAGLILATSGIFYIIYVDAIFKSALRWFFTLRPNSKVADLWQNPMLVITVDLYIMNWTNPHEFKNHSTKPQFTELGPYRFIEKPRKINVTWHPENATVSYFKKAHFYFDEEGSVGRMDDRIIAPNLFAMAIYRKIKDWSTMKRSFVDLALKLYGNQISMEHSADEYLFKGFDTALLRLERMIPIPIPDLDLPYEKIAYGYPRNGSTEVYGHHNIYTGADDFRKLGQIAKWRYSGTSKTYPQCGQISGSTGEFHPAPLQKGKPISYFIPDICRDLEMDYEGTATVQGIDGYRYIASERNMANGTFNKANSCYCANNSCPGLYTGLMNISSCWYDSPVFASYPHFYKADPYYVQQVDSMKPNKERHEMSVVLEPTTGFVLDLKGRLMLSLLVEPMPTASIFRDTPRTFFPLIWCDYKTQISPEFATYIKLLPVLNTGTKILALLVICCGVIMMVWYPKKLCWNSKYMRKIDITGMDSRVSGITKQEQIKSFAEGSPLLMGVEFMDKVQSVFEMGDCLDCRGGSVESNSHLNENESSQSSSSRDSLQDFDSSPCLENTDNATNTQNGTISIKM